MWKKVDQPGTHLSQMETLKINSVAQSLVAESLNKLMILKKGSFLVLTSSNISKSSRYLPAVGNLRNLIAFLLCAGNEKLISPNESSFMCRAAQTCI